MRTWVKNNVGVAARTGRVLNFEYAIDSEMRCSSHHSMNASTDVAIAITAISAMVG